MLKDDLPGLCEGVWKHYLSRIRPDIVPHPPYRLNPKFYPAPPF